MMSRLHTISRAALLLLAMHSLACQEKPIATSQPLATPQDPDAEVAATSAAAPLPTTPDAPFRQKAPEPGPAAKLQFPEVKQLALKNGMKILLVQRTQLPLVSGTLLFQGGSARNPSGKEGLASMTMAMLDEGTKKRSALEISDMLERLGMDFGASSDADSLSISMSSLKETLTDSMALFGELVQSPAFDEKELERLRADRLTAIAQQKDQPAAMSQNNFGAVVFGSKHPYGAPEGGTEASVKSFSKKDLEAFYKENITPANATLVLVGDLSEQEALAAAEKTFGTWKGKAPKPNVPEKSKENFAGKILLVDRAGAPQSVVRIGGLGISRLDPDFYALQVMNEIFGGAFTSRLNLNLREKHGWSYGARSGVSARKGIGSFSASANVQSDKTVESVQEMLNELTGMADRAPSDDELALAKNALTQSLTGRFEANAAIAGTLSSLTLYGLPLDYYQGYADQINKVSKEDVMRVAKKYLDPKQLVIVVVGPKDRALDGLSKLGSVEMRDAFGNVVK
jgi:zinc protease